MNKKFKSWLNKYIFLLYNFDFKISKSIYFNNYKNKILRWNGPRKN